LEELDQIFEGKASEFYTGEYVFENWGQHQFTLGTWTNAATNAEFNPKALNQSLQRKVYFAGEIYDVHKQLGVPGAILSGYNSIDRLLNNEK
jgi:monoamine oxidase